MADLLGGFAPQTIDAGDVHIQARVGGQGPALLLLHGYPQSMVMWHRVAPRLSGDFTVVLADLRGYGASDKPPGGPDHAEYTKRVMADDMVTVMSRLGHERFAVVGHDRGGRVAHRMALDAPDRATAVAVLDIVPTRHMFTHVDRAMATSYFHWFFLALGSDLPETLINADPEAWIDSRFAGRHAGGSPIDPLALEEYRRAFRDPRTVHGSCEDYRAASGPDLALDHADHAAGRRMSQPTLALWGSKSYVGRTFDVLEVWRDYASDVTGHPIAADHYLAEEAPDATADAIQRFLQGVRP